jgi:hypothetical protein
MFAVIVHGEHPLERSPSTSRQHLLLTDKEQDTAVVLERQRDSPSVTDPPLSILSAPSSSQVREPAACSLTHWLPGKHWLPSHRSQNSRGSHQRRNREPLIGSQAAPEPSPLFMGAVLYSALVNTMSLSLLLSFIPTVYLLGNKEHESLRVFRGN